ncbi:unnamed protein product [Arctia plantaginis]|uniref:Uncharacterized protein n=1 Tax=Arctia plantaginis TaxID=874455 RepID=A0A8S1BC22_ARCPL|nr:unnamed protein product [Arctia plantaginis]
MKVIHAVFVYTTLVNACVIARGGRGGGSRGGRGRSSSRSSHGSHGLRGSHGYHHVTSGHSHYRYYPPKQIHYTCRHCLSTASYPVYRHQLPNYVYVYKESRGRNNQLLTGLAIYNLGRSHSGSGTRYSGYQREKCSLQVIENHYFEETEFPCFMISSFTESSPNNNLNTIDITSSEIKVKPDLYDGSTLQVTEDQECVLWRNISTRNERHSVPCELLKKYADTVQPSLVEPLMYVFIPIFGTGIMVILCYYVCTTKQK